MTNVNAETQIIGIKISDPLDGYLWAKALSMVTVEEAKAAVVEHTPVLGSRTASVPEAMHHVLSEDVRSPIDMPPFPQSAMDGYALGGNILTEGTEFTLVGEVAAGSPEIFELKDGECVRIFTGAPVPESASAVVQQEWVERAEDSIKLTQDVKPQMHIRPQGEQMQQGDVALEKGSYLNPAAIGFLSMLGLTQVEVYIKPRVNILVTGNELVRPGNGLKHGQIYESNSAMLVAALHNEEIGAGCHPVPDDFDATLKAISSALETCDLLILSGGISVGDHDHVGNALLKLGVEQLFYKVRQKPGKPLFFGRMGEKLVFALPGNPAASLSCYYEYVRNAIRRMQNHPKPEQIVLRLPLSSSFVNKGGRSQFLKAKVVDSKVELLGGQSSAMLSSFSVADGLVYVPSEEGELAEGDEVEIHLIS